MNPLLEQFLSESRELLEDCIDIFLQLEQAPEDQSTLNHLFRNVHTIKGGSGLFDIAAFTQLVHVTEDSLSKAREGKIQIDAEGIDLYLRVLDQLAAWLDELEASDKLGEHSQQNSLLLIDEVQVQILGEQKNAPEVVSQSTAQKSVQLSAEDMIKQLNLNDLRAELLSELREQLSQVQQECTLVVYRPESNAFFCGDDPVSYWTQVPGLIWQGIDGIFDDQALIDFDPFECRLTLVGLSVADQQELHQSLDYVWQNVQMMPVQPSTLQQDSKDAADGHLYQILHCQFQVLSEIANNPHPAASIESVARVLARLSSSIPEVAKLPALQTDGHTVDPAYLGALQAILQQCNSEPSSSAPELVNQPDNTEAAPMQSQPVSLANDELSAANKRANDAKQDPIRTIKVDQERLEQLVDLTGELIVAKNSLQHLARRVEQEYGIKALSRDIKNEHAVLNRITESMQDVVMQIRMIPVSTIFQRFPRLVRDLSRRLGKNIDLQVEGEETEADKNIVEQLSDPLIHLVRNSIDHGIEMPEQRSQAGKNSTGVIRLVAKNVEDSVQIEIHDDGAGIDPDVIKAKAIAKGVISEEQAAGMSTDEILQLIFEPGFSTKEQVSDLSGRGVGMDVVKTTVARIGGTIDLRSTKGEGSVITVKLPASITVSRVMMFEVNDQVYGIPVEGLTETIKIRPKQIRCIKRGESYVLRNKLIPLYRMHQLLGIRQTTESEELPILNLNINGTMAGFAVDKLLEGVDVIIKPLEGVMARFPLYSGAAVLGDGRVLLVINPKEMSLCH